MSSSSSPDYDALLDSFGRIACMVGEERSIRPIRIPELANLGNQVTAARSSLKDYVAKIEAENERLREEQPETSLLAARSRLARISELESSLAELRASLPTPEEAAIVLNRLQDKASPEIPRAVLWDAMEKLRALSRLSRSETEVK